MSLRRNQIVSPTVLSVLFLIILRSASAGTETDSTKNVRHPLLIAAEQYYKERDLDKTIAYCLRALENPDVNKNPEVVIEFKNLLGASYIKIRSYDKALASLNEGLSIGQKNLPADHALIGESHFHLGVYYDQTGVADQSIQHHQQALSIRLKHFGENHLKLAESYNGLGEVYLYTILDNKKATANFQKSVRILEIQLKPDDYDLYVAYFNLASSNRRLGDTDKALTYAFKALSVVNSKKEYYSKLEKCFTLLGNIYYSKTEFDKAIEYMTKGIEQSIATDGPNNYELILKYTNLGVAKTQIGQLSNAIQCFKKSLMIDDLQRYHNANMQGDNFLHTGVAFQKSGQFDSANFYLKKCFSTQVAKNGPKHLRTSQALGYLARLFQDFTQLDSAAVYIQKSLVAAIKDFDQGDFHYNPSLGQIGEHYDLFLAFGNKGSILLDLYLAHPADFKILQSSLESYKIADKLMELNRNSFQGEGSKLFFADHYHNIYEKALEVSSLLFNETHNESYVADALMFMEKSKAFLLLESLKRAEVFNQVGIPDSIRQIERNLSSEFVHYRSLLENKNQKTDFGKEQQRLQSNLFQLIHKREKLMDILAQQYPNYFQLKYEETSGLSQIKEYTRKTNSTVIEYFWGTKKVYALAVSGERIMFKELSQVDSLDAAILQYSMALETGRIWNEHEYRFNAFIASSHDIYIKLVAPLLAGGGLPKKLIFVRDGPLLFVPFESMLISKSESNLKDYRKLDYLIQHYTISYAHSANLLVRGTSKTQRADQGQVLAFSYSVLDVRNEMPEPGRQEDSLFYEIPGAAQEIGAISKILPGRFFQGEEATEHRFKLLAQDFDILHLAVHGRADPQIPFSGSLFFKQSQDSVEDGELHIYELYDLSLKARLAVLSACKSGVGKFYKGEGVFSIASGFAYAGCPSTVITLWNINDETSAQIMIDFYQKLNEGRDIDEALRSAKLAYLESAGDFRGHPIYWAAFIPVGNMEPLLESKRGFWIWSLVFAIIGISGFIGLRKLQRMTLFQEM